MACKAFRIFLQHIYLIITGDYADMRVHYKGPGKVFYRDKEYKCDLYLNEDEGGNLCRVTVDQAIASTLILPLEFTYLLGELDNGYRFTLYKAIRTAHKVYPQANIDIFEYQADYIFSGIRMNERERSFHSVSYVLSNIIHWGGITPFEIDREYRLGLNASGDIHEVLYSDDEYCISYSVIASKRMISRHDLMQEEITLRQQGAIIITSNKKEQEIAYFDERFNKIRQLIEYVTLMRINVEAISAQSSNYIHQINEDYAYQQDIAIYGPDIHKMSENEDINNRQRFYLASMRELIEHHSFMHYLDIHSKLQPVIDLYLEPIESHQSARRSFLNIVQALETYHSRFIVADISDYKTRVAMLVEATYGDKDALQGLLLSCKRTLTLRDRLADLLYADGQLYFETGDISRSEFPKVIADTRNYYIHYDEKRRQKLVVLVDDQLQIYSRVLLKILDYYVLKELGFNISNKEFKEGMNLRWGDIPTELMLLKASRAGEVYILEAPRRTRRD